MPKPLPQHLQLPLEFEFTNEEILEHCQLSPMQHIFLETLRAQEIRKRGMLEFNPANTLQFCQEEAYCKARRELLEYLLNLDKFHPVEPTAHKGE